MTPVERPGGRRLVLLRHAKAEPAGRTPDALRPLALAGRRQCFQVGAGLAASGLLPEHVLVSSAVRTRQTWDLVRTALGDVPEPEVDISDAVYDAHAGSILDLVRAVDDRVATLLVVGHEPTMSSAASVLARVDHEASAAHLAGVRSGLPTAGYAVLEVSTWAELGRGTAVLMDVVRPAR